MRSLNAVLCLSVAGCQIISGGADLTVGTSSTASGAEGGGGQGGGAAGGTATGGSGTGGSAGAGGGIDCPPSVTPGAGRGALQLADVGTLKLDVQAVLADGLGNTYVAGSYRGSMLECQPSDPAFDDGFVLELNSDLEPSACVQIHSGTSDARVRAMAKDGAGNVYIAGFFGGSVLWGGTPRPASAVDGFVAKLSSGGVQEWFTQLSGGGTQMVAAMARSPTTGNLFVGGMFENALTVSGVSTSIPMAGWGDMFLIELTDEGKLDTDTETKLGFGLNVGADEITSIAVGSTGKVAFGAIVRPEGAASLALGSNIGSVDVDGSSSGVVVTLPATGGEPNWARTVRGGGLETVLAVAVDDGDRVAFAGTHANTAHICEPLGDPLFTLGGGVGQSTYLAIFEANGTTVDAGVAVAASGEVFGVARLLSLGDQFLFGGSYKGLGFSLLGAPNLPSSSSSTFGFYGRVESIATPNGYLKQLPSTLTVVGGFGVDSCGDPMLGVTFDDILAVEGLETLIAPTIQDGAVVWIQR